MTDHVTPLAATAALQASAPLASSGTITFIVIAICAGVILAALYNFYIRRVPGSVVRLLLSRGALSPETALSAEELGLLEKPFALWELLRGSSLRHIVAAVPAEETAQNTNEQEADEKEADEQEADEKEADEQKTDEKEADEGNQSAAATEESAWNSKTRFYIPADKKYRAQLRFEEKGNGVVGLAITCALTVVLGILLVKLIPLGLSAIGNLFH